ncbi:unconventional prefoldin RPB5 interactor-like [Schistocerca gregaria]|uniref:unconventional prefoldin RPB5 interactor-like n=1 Tax=Schistocerca gregaria TaxID=7010 RepID=UPI00211DF13C|nr:unconventional prefoldin RPB5 interactor-like [Schistocerca gregaria]
MTDPSEKVTLAQNRLASIIHSNRLDAAYYEKFKKDYDQIDSLLKDLPNKLTHHVMVPLNSAAFMMGCLEHTNEITVFLGCDYFVKTTAKQARAILSRRQDFVKSKLKACEDLYLELKSKVGLVSEVLGTEEGFSEQIEIREKVDEPFDLVLPSGSILGADECDSSRDQKEKKSQAPKIEVISQEETTCEVNLSPTSQQEAYNNKILDILMKMEESEIEVSDTEIQQAFLNSEQQIDEGTPNKGESLAMTQHNSDKEAHVESATGSDHRDVVEMLQPVGRSHANVGEEEKSKRVSQFKAQRLGEKK